MLRLAPKLQPTPAAWPDQDKVPYTARAMAGRPREARIPNAIAKSIYYTICDRANPTTGEWKLDLKTLAAEAGCKPRTVTKWLPVLERYGWIKVFRSHGRAWSTYAPRLPKAAPRATYLEKGGTTCRTQEEVLDKGEEGRPATAGPAASLLSASKKAKTQARRRTERGQPYHCRCGRFWYAKPSYMAKNPNCGQCGRAVVTDREQVRQQTYERAPARPIDQKAESTRRAELEAAARANGWEQGQDGKWRKAMVGQTTTAWKCERPPDADPVQRWGVPQTRVRELLAPARAKLRRLPSKLSAEPSTRATGRGKSDTSST